jgi:hypothetical protein
MKELHDLIDLRLRADDNPRLNDLYQFALRDVRPSRSDFDYIDQQVSIRRAQMNTGSIPPGSLAGPGSLPSSVVIPEFIRATPLVRTYPCINRVGSGWSNDTRMVEKAYVMACFSEAAYLHLAEHEVPGRNRYKLFPNALLQELIRHQWRINIREVILAVADIPVEIIVTRRFVYVVYKVNTFVAVAVRGTVPHVRADWAINLNALKTMGFHRGFFGEAREAMPELSEAVNRVGGEKAILYFTGHSLGGAVASVLARVWAGNHQVMTPYVFASPRFASEQVVQSAPPYGYVAPNDLVPHFPPRFFGFADAGLPPELVPLGRPWMSGIRTLVHWLTPGKGLWKPHSVELYRYELGQRVGEAFPQDVYINALMRAASR